MVRHRLLGSVRLTLIAALLGSLLVATASVVSAAASITATPGSASANPIIPGNFYIPFGTTALDLDVDCGAPTSACSVWVARNNAAKPSEVLFTNVTGKATLIPVGFINDGCFNFRLYDSAHAVLLGLMSVGHGHVASPDTSVVCNADGTAQPMVRFNGLRGGIGYSFDSGIILNSLTPKHGPVEWDSGFFGGVEDSQVWVTESKPFRPITDCNAISFPNSNEVLYAQNVSGQKQDLQLIGGGPYCFNLYQGTSHATRIVGPVSVSFGPYLQYTGGTANGSLDKAGGTVYFNSGDGAVNALVCVYGSAIPGSSAANQVAFTFNSEGWNPGGTFVPFQTIHVSSSLNANVYTLRTGITNRNPDGSPTNRSCVTGAVKASFTVTT